MSWFIPSDNLSNKARKVLNQLAESGSSEAAGVADILNTIAENDKESAKDAFLVTCAEEIRDYANEIIIALEVIPK